MKEVVAIVGGGAAGMTAAITASGRGKQVILLERGPVLGKKILATGNGKCNFSNRDMKDSFFYSDDPGWLHELLQKYPTDKICDFFRQSGIQYREKNGYLYPYSEQAATVRDMLEWRLRELGVRVVCGEKIVSIKKTKEGFCLTGERENYRAQKVILACGGMASPKTGSDGNGYGLAKQLGHSVTKVYPSLVQLMCREKYCKSLAGIRAQGVVTVLDSCKGKAQAMQGQTRVMQGQAQDVQAQTRVMQGQIPAMQEQGEIQLTDYGISGIPVFQLSGYINVMLEDRKEVITEIDFLPEYSKEECMEMLFSRVKCFGGRSVKEGLCGIVNSKLMDTVLTLAGVSAAEKMSTLSGKKIEKIADVLKKMKFTVYGSKSFEQAQVTRGGVPLSQVDCHMESKLCKGLFFCGEILNVDGICGGYNLHFAWASGMEAGLL